MSEMKYKVSKDIPKFAREYNTISPSNLARIVSKRKHKQITPESISMWFKNHPEIHSKLAKLIETRSCREAPKQIPDVKAKLVSDEYGKIEIIDLETVELATKQLAIIECDIKAQICNQAKLQIIHKNFTQKVIECKHIKPKNKGSTKTITDRQKLRQTQPKKSTS